MKSRVGASSSRLSNDSGLSCTQAVRAAHTPRPAGAVLGNGAGNSSWCATVRQIVRAFLTCRYRLASTSLLGASCQPVASPKPWRMIVVGAMWASGRPHHELAVLGGRQRRPPEALAGTWFCLRPPSSRDQVPWHGWVAHRSVPAAAGQSAPAWATCGNPVAMACRRLRLSCAVRLTVSPRKGSMKHVWQTDQTQDRCLHHRYPRAYPWPWDRTP